jgi:hypothetical protein
MCSGVAKILGQSEVDKIYVIVNSGHEMIRLYVTVYVVTSMNGFHGMELKNVNNGP